MLLLGLEPREIMTYHKIIITARGQVETAKVKANALNEEIATEKRKLDAIDSNDTASRKVIEDKIKILTDKRNAQQENIPRLKNIVVNQKTRIMETFNKMTNNDLALSKKIKLLLKEQGVTIISILTGVHPRVHPISYSPFFVLLLTPNLIHRLLYCFLLNVLLKL